MSDDLTPEMTTHWERVNAEIIRVRDASPRLANDADSADITDAVLAIPHPEVEALRAENDRLRVMWDRSGKNDLIAEIKELRAKLLDKGETHA